MASKFLTHWRGLVLSLIGIAATVWLAITDQLGLYIHPRYFVFTVVMAIIAVVFVVGAIAFPQGDHDDEHASAPRWKVRLWAALSGALVAVAGVALLLLPPATLTTTTVAQRDMNGSVSGGSQNENVTLEGGNSDSLTVRDWASLLRSGADENFLAGERPKLVGFVTPDEDDPDNVFYVARFVVTCCAVDAQPIGVPVYAPGWRERFDVDDWVRVEGAFVPNPSISSAQAIVVLPDTIKSTERPKQPYVY